jgi:photosystem II stability/assembly factor-like uncharacterized protein
LGSMNYLWVFPAVLALASPAVRAQEPAPGATAGAPAPPPVIENHGKPMLLPFRCGAEDIRAAGLSCTEEEPCPVFLELSSVASPSAGHLLVAGNIHTESATLYSTLLASEDAGRSWSEVYERMRGAGLDHIQFSGADTGWVSGQELVPVSQNPFLLLTADGGRTWVKRPILSDSADNRFGSVQQFYFADKTGGLLILARGQGGGTDRYALYESQTGGQSWDIRQESATPLRLKQPPPASDWRVMVDAASRSFHIEHRQGERWSVVAAFEVKLDPCKPPTPAPDPGGDGKP